MAVDDAVHRYVDRVGSLVFTLDALVATELSTIIAETASVADNPRRALKRELQRLCDVGVLEPVDYEAYRLRDVRSYDRSAGPAKGIFVAGLQSIDSADLERNYSFDAKWLQSASRMIGNWVIYQDSDRHCYFAVARIATIVSHPSVAGTFQALIEPGTFLEFGRDVPTLVDGQAVERGRYFPSGRLSSDRIPIRVLSEDDFDRILAFGLVDTGDGDLPSHDVSPGRVREEQSSWTGPVDRTRKLMSRTVRDPQFRRRVLTAYDGRCAASGHRIIDSRGNVETQAAHVVNVQSGGSDRLTNGVALCATAHWMFDRGVMSFSDDGGILLSRSAGAAERNLISADRRAHFPADLLKRPDLRYLAWHREHVFIV